MAELFSNDGVRTYINSQNEIDNLPWSGKINFKKLRIKDAKKIALEKALERHQALADVVRLILPGGALTQEQVSVETAKASELLVNYVSRQEQTLAEELRNLQNEIEVLKWIGEDKGYVAANKKLFIDKEGLIFKFIK